MYIVKRKLDSVDSLNREFASMMKLRFLTPENPALKGCSLENLLLCCLALDSRVLESAKERREGVVTSASKKMSLLRYSTFSSHNRNSQHPSIIVQLYLDQKFQENIQVTLSFLQVG